MTTDRIHRLVVAALGEVAPDVDPTALDADLHDELGLDSIDLLNFTSALQRHAGVEIPEADLPGLRTLRAVEHYLSTRGE